MDRLNVYGGIVWIAAVAVFAGCSSEGAVLPSIKTQWPQPEASAVWHYAVEHDYRKNWSFWPGKGKLYKGKEPHGAYLTTYVNDIALDALTNRASTMPRGALIVKENYGPDKKLAATTIMYKAEKGYNPQHHDWFFMKRLADGKVEASGRVNSCAACHSTSKRDYMMTPLP